MRQRSPSDVKTITTFEREVITILMSSHLGDDQIAELLDSAVLDSLEHTGVGYFLTLRHPKLPSARKVFDEPMVTGTSDEMQCGFVVFVENGELTLECHSWGDSPLPSNLRQRPVRIETTRDSKAAVRFQASTE